MNNSKSSASSNPTSEKTSEIFDFYRGVPRAEWDYMVRDGFLSGKEVLLLKIINTLSKTGDGCWASNRYLGDSTGRSPNRITDTLKFMKDNGLVEIEYHNVDNEPSRRIRLTPEGSSTYVMGKKYDSKQLHSGLPPTQNRVGVKTLVNSDDPHPGKGRPPTQDRVNPPPRIGYIKKNKRKEENIEEEYCLTPQSVADAPSCVSDDSTVKLHKQATLFTPLQQACHELAVKLENELRRHKKLKRPADLKKWARLFTDLVNTLDGGLPYLTDMLNWYFTVIGEKYTPKLYSATSICHEFEKLVAARERAEEFSHKVTSPPKTTSKETTDVPLSPEEEEIYDSLSKLTWPKDSFRVLKYSIHKSYVFYELFKDRLYDYMKEHPTCYLAIELYHQFPGTIDYLNGYYEEVNRIVHNWKEWNGSYLPHVSLIDKILFRKHLYDIATEFGATVGECDDLMTASGIKGGAK